MTPDHHDRRPPHPKMRQGRRAQPAATFREKQSGLQEFSGGLELVFDDGPCDDTALVLDALGSAGVAATFFVVGSRIEGREGLLVRMAEEGHRVGNHSWSHPLLAELGYSAIVCELAATQFEVQRVLGVAPSRFRSPFVRRSEAMSAAARHVGLREEFNEPSVGDYLVHDPVALAEIARAAAFETGFVGLHDTHPPTVAALPLLLEGLA
jgi:peptidoglycan/xylan/chitin deacetylase (PgdA/CDA1 family)